MPRIVPSQVVAFLDTIPLPPDEGFSTHAYSIDTADVSGLVDLLGQIPEELLSMDASTYALFICYKARIRDTALAWSAHTDSTLHPSRFLMSPLVQALRGIRDALARCPDESPAPATSELKFITDTDLRANLRNDIGAVGRALSNGEWKAATVLSGSTIEALLLWSLGQRPPVDITTATTALVSSRKLSRQPDSNLDRWDLHEYNEVAYNLGLIKDDTYTKTNLAREYRNLIHPGRAKRLGQTCDRGTALSSVAALEHVVRDLSR
jgi:hypothetical protein